MKNNARALNLDFIVHSTPIHLNEQVEFTLFALIELKISHNQHIVPMVAPLHSLFNQRTIKMRQNKLC